MKLPIKTLNLHRLPSVLILVTVPVLLFYLTESYIHNPFTTMLPGIQFLNILFFEVVMLMGCFVFGSGRVALIIQTIVFALIGLANYFVLEFRSAPIMPWDLLSIRTAAGVADNYSFQLSSKAVTILLCFLGCLILSFFCDVHFKGKKLRVSGSVIGLTVLLSFVNYVQSTDCLYRFRLYDKLFTPTTMTYKDGTVVAFCMQLPYLFIEKPEGYSIMHAEELLSHYSSEKNQNNLTSQPNIIVIMNEAFSDLELLGDFTASEDPLPFVRSRLSGAENTQSGYLHVSVLGGNTANTEYEYLTGQTMAFLPQGSIPYQQHIKGKTFSLASHLKQMGYRTIAIHPYGATGWQRHQVYPRLGFDTFLSLADFGNAPRIRKYVSDEAGYQRIIRLFENKKAEEPLFIFNVTMQNHSSYTEIFDNFTPFITVEGSDNAALSQYLSLIKVSDLAIEELVSYFEQQEEDTLIVFFGDHQPTDSVVQDIYRLNDKSLREMTHEETALRYQVPFFLWANYDIEEADGLHLSPNYLGNLTLDAAGLKFSPLHLFLEELQKDFPVVSSIEVQNHRGTVYEVKEKSEELKDYSILQYYYLMEEDK